MTDTKGPSPANGLRAKPEVVENILAPELFASEAFSFAHAGDVLTITLVSNRWDNSTLPGAPKSVVVGRLVMPMRGVQGLVGGLYDYLQRNGVDPFARPTQPSKVQ